eukprot:TRINITY_DN22689_c0_g1_i1.p1 TRINITY_DN22689_c0_g1~~TRINITY_DN22689_c0_g1_i1.p1  ORF type:complete len:523 (+),score=152.85 TRINITY_DN22689_c0_g1_i1:79-1647(+)
MPADSGLSRAGRESVPAEAMRVPEGGGEDNRGDEGFVELLDHLCGELMTKLPAKPFQNVVDCLAEWGLEKQMRTHVEVGGTSATQHILAKGVEDLNLQRKRVLVHVNLSTVYDAHHNLVHLGALKGVQRTLSSLVVQCPVVLLVHLEDLARPDAPPPSVEPLIPALQSVIGGTSVRFFPTLDYRKVTGLGVGEVAVLENLLTFPAEVAGDRAFAITLSRLGDIYVNEAFPSLHLGHASCRYLPFLVEQYGLGYSCADCVSALHTTTSNPALPYVVCYGGLGPLKGSRAAALLESVYTADELILLGRPGLLYLHCKAGVPLEALPVVGGEPCTEGEAETLSQVIALAARLGRGVRGPVDHTVLAVRGRKQRRQVSTSPQRGSPVASATYRVEVQRSERLEIHASNTFPLPPKAEYFGVGPETVAMVAKAVVQAETSLVIDTLGAVRHTPSRDASNPEALSLVNLDMCPTRLLLKELADAQAVQQRRAKFVGWKLLDVVEASGLGHKIRGVIPGEEAPLRLLLT